MENDVVNRLEQVNKWLHRIYAMLGLIALLLVIYLFR